MDVNPQFPALTGDSAELWVTLNAMGYDYNLVQDEAALFKVLSNQNNICINYGKVLFDADRESILDAFFMDDKS